MRERDNNFYRDFEDYNVFEPDLLSQNEALTNIIQTSPQAVPTTSSATQKLIDQIMGQNTSSKWTGEGLGSAQANAAEMAKILAGIGITDINQFGKITKTVDAAVQPVYGQGDEVTDSEGQTGYSQKIVGYVDQNGNAVDPNLVKTEYISGGESGSDSVVYVAPVGTQEVFGNKETGQEVPNTYSERQTGNFFGGTFAGKGNTGYGVQFGPDGTPYFYTQGASSNDLANLIKDLGPVGQIGLAFATAGMSLPAQLATNFAIQVASGVPVQDAVKGVVTGFVTNQLLTAAPIKEATAAINQIDTTGVLGKTFQGATAGAVNAAVKGNSILDGALAGAENGLASGVSTAGLNSIDDFKKLDTNEQKILTNVVGSVLSGKTAEQIALNAAISAASDAGIEFKKNLPLDADIVAELTPEELAKYEEGGTKGLMAYQKSIKDAMKAAEANAPVINLQNAGLTEKSAQESASLDTPAAEVPATTDQTNYDSIIDEVLNDIAQNAGTNIEDSGLSNQAILDLINANPANVVITGEKDKTADVVTPTTPTKTAQELALEESLRLQNLNSAGAFDPDVQKNDAVVITGQRDQNTDNQNFQTGLDDLANFVPPVGSVVDNNLANLVITGKLDQNIENQNFQTGLNDLADFISPVGSVVNNNLDELVITTNKPTGLDLSTPKTDIVQTLLDSNAPTTKLTDLKQDVTNQPGLTVTLPTDKDVDPSIRGSGRVPGTGQSPTGPLQLMEDYFGTDIARINSTPASAFKLSSGGDIDELLRLLRS